MKTNARTDRSELEGGLHQIAKGPKGFGASTTIVFITTGRLTKGTRDVEGGRGDRDVVCDLELIEQLHGVVTVVRSAAFARCLELWLTDGEAEQIAFDEGILPTETHHPIL